MTSPTSSPPSGPPPPWDHRHWREVRHQEWASKLRGASNVGGLSHLAMGIFLTLLGGVLTLDSLQLVDASRVLRFWPIGFHVLGITILLRRSDNHGRFWGAVSLLAGTWLLLNSLGLTRVGFFDLFWPLLLVFVGVRLILRGRAGDILDGFVPDRLRTSSSTGASGPRTANLVAVLGESKGSVKEALVKASMTSIMGGCHLDLRQASIPPGEQPVIDVFAVMGGQEIVVPPGWAVDFDVISILAGTEDKRLPSVAGTLDAALPRVTIRGVLIMGGLSVSN